MSNKNSYKEILILGVVTLVSCLGYLLFCYQISGIGFPLDDAWIHQTFARNFGENFQWSFQLGQPSGGSTGPLWGLVLSVLYILKIPPLWGTYFIGFLTLWGTSIAGFSLGKRLLPGNKFGGLGAGILIALEWHLVWSALSGMETLLLSLISLVLFSWLLDHKDNWWIVGALIGVSIWIRPDGLTLIGPAGLGLLLRSYSKKDTFKKATEILSTLVVFCGFYFLFNWIVAGDIWPNTFYAKQAEYASLKDVNLLYRYFNIGLQVITGVGVLLLPGMVLEINKLIRTRKWIKSGLFLWAFGYIGLYAWRLPVTYQHGRYIMPAMPVLFILGFVGLVDFIDLRSNLLRQRIISGVWASATIVIIGVFWAYGGRAFALDVGVINSEMVQTAYWVKDNTPQGAIIGAHDIGALGYFANRQIIDLAGLISPTVIPFIRDESKLSDYLSLKNTDYLVIFPSWYPVLSENLNIIYQSDGEIPQLFGMDNMTVYSLK